MSFGGAEQVAVQPRPVVVQLGVVGELCERFAEGFGGIGEFSVGQIASGQCCEVFCGGFVFGKPQQIWDGLGLAAGAHVECRQRTCCVVGHRKAVADYCEIGLGYIGVAAVEGEHAMVVPCVAVQRVAAQDYAEVVVGLPVATHFQQQAGAVGSRGGQCRRQPQSFVKSGQGQRVAPGVGIHHAEIGEQKTVVGAVGTYSDCFEQPGGGIVVAFFGHSLVGLSSKEEARVFLIVGHGSGGMCPGERQKHQKKGERCRQESHRFCAGAKALGYSICRRGRRKARIIR